MYNICFRIYRSFVKKYHVWTPCIWPAKGSDHKNKISTLLGIAICVSIPKIIEIRCIIFVLEFIEVLLKSTMFGHPVYGQPKGQIIKINFPHYLGSQFVYPYQKLLKFDV